MRVPTMDEARTIWRRAIAAMVRRGAAGRVYEWHLNEERPRVRGRRSSMTDEQRREEWRRHQRAKRARDARAA